MKKIISILLSIFIIVLCIPCSNVYGNVHQAAVLEINFCDEDGNNNQHIIYEDGEHIPYVWPNSSDAEEIAGLEVVPTCDDKGVYTYTIQISDDVDLFFNAFTAESSLKQAQENKVVIDHEFSNCIKAYNSNLKIESIDGDHALTIHFLNSDFPENENIYCIDCFGPVYNDTLYGCENGVYFGGEENQLTLDFYCDNYDEEEINPIVSAFDIGCPWLGDDELSYYYAYFNNLKSTAVLTSSYIQYLSSGSLSRATFENGCDIKFTNIDPFDELPSGMGEGYDRGFLRLNGEAYFYDSKISAYLNDTEIEINDYGDITCQIPNVGIASNNNITFKDSEIHMEGIAAVATYKNIIIDNTKAEFIGRLAGIISVCFQPNCIQYINPGSDSYLVIETKEPDTKKYGIEGLGYFNGAAAIVPGQIIPLLFAGIYAEGSKDVEGDEYKPLRDISSSDYGDLKRIKVGNPFDFELRYYEDGMHKSCKYYKGTQLYSTDNLPQGITLEEYDENREYPYVLTVDGERTIYCDVNDLVQINDVNKSLPVAYSLYFTQNLLIQGKDENSRLVFADFGDANGKVFSYDIVSGDVNPDVKLKITIPYLHFDNRVNNFDSVVFGNGNRADYDYPNIFNISSHNIEINGIKDGSFSSPNVCIEYLSNLTITDSKLRFSPINYKCASDDSYINFIVSNSEAEGEYTKLSKCCFNQSEITFDGAPLFGTNLGVRAVIAANFIDISLGEFEVNDSVIVATNANFMVGPAEFKDCPKIVLNNADSASSLPNFISCGGTLSFSDSNYEITSKNNNIEFWDYFDGPDFKLYFEQDEEHSGSFTANGGCCIYAEDVEVTNSETTEILANTMMDGSVNVPYNNDDRDSYKYLLINYLPPLPNIVEVPTLYPTTTGDGHIHYYYDEVNDLYYEDPFGNIPILDIDKWLSTSGRIPSLKEENKKCDITVYTIGTREIIPSLTIKSPVKENDYLFESDYIGRFIGVVINNKPLTMKVDYSLVEGDTPIIKLSDAVLNNLPNGTNKIYIVFIDGFGYKEFTIQKDSKPDNPSNPGYIVPKTGIK